MAARFHWTQEHNCACANATELKHRFHCQHYRHTGDRFAGTDGDSVAAGLRYWALARVLPSHLAFHYAGNILILLLTALLTAAGTLAGRSLSFIGLLAPQCARVLGAYTPRLQLLVATLQSRVAHGVGRLAGP
jgi:hypothetical protein